MDSGREMFVYEVNLRVVCSLKMLIAKLKNEAIYCCVSARASRRQLQFCKANGEEMLTKFVSCVLCTAR